MAPPSLLNFVLYFWTLIQPACLSACLGLGIKFIKFAAEARAAPAGNEQAAILLKLLSSALQPLLQSLQAWLCDARLPASHEEFFVLHGGRSPHTPSPVNLAEGVEQITASQIHFMLRF